MIVCQNELNQIRYTAQVKCMITVPCFAGKDMKYHHRFGLNLDKIDASELLIVL